MMVRLGLMITCSSLSLISTEAAAQAVDQATGAPLSTRAEQTDATDIVVTGSRLRGKITESVQPIQTVGAAEIGDKALPDVASVLSQLPTFGPGSSRNGTQGRFGVGQSFADFFSLGSQRTLTVVNGRRFVSSNPAVVFYGGPVPGSQVDLNVIPTLLIDRVETVAVGGAPVYGSDAIAGTLNVILKKKYKGLELSADYGIFDRGDAPSYRLRGIYGTQFAGDRGSIVVSAEYYRAKGLLQSDRARTRDWLSFVPPAGNSPFLNVAQNNIRYNLFNDSGIPLFADGIPSGTGVRDAQGRLLTFGSNGTLRPFVSGQPTGLDFIEVGGEGYRASDFKNLLSETERWNASTIFNYKITEGIIFFSEGYFARSKSRTLNNEPNYVSAFNDAAGQPGGSLVLSLNNPFLAPSARAQIAASLAANGLTGQNTFLLARTNSDLTPGDTRAKTDVWRIVSGLNGNLSVGGRSLEWEIAFNYGQSNSDNLEPAIVYQNLLNALDAVSGPNGSIICRPGAPVSPYPTISSTCAPLNVFGANTASPEAVRYITAYVPSSAKNTLRDITATVQGEVFSLPGGGVKALLGYENRRESASFDVDTFFEQGLGLGGRARDTSGSFTTNEIFSEVRVPIVGSQNEMPLLNRLEAQGAARYVDHSTAGGDFTYTAGLTYSPFSAISLRGNYTRSIRAPSIIETNLSPVTQFSSANDPCDARFRTSGPNPAARAANCTAAGLPANFTSIIVNNSRPLTQSGNSSLKNERANSWTVGAVLQPRSMPGVSLSVDWVNIKLANAIERLGVQTILETCYDASDYPSNPACGLFSRDGTGQITGARQTYVNAGSKQMRGLQVALTADFRLPSVLPGKFSARANYFYLDRLRTSIAGGAPVEQAGEIGFSKHRATVYTSYSDDNFLVGLTGNYIGAAKFSNAAASNTYDIPKVPGWFTLDAVVGFNVKERFSLRFIVDNLFDRNAPYPVGIDDIGLATYSQGILGRRLTVSASTRF